MSSGAIQQGHLWVDAIGMHTLSQGCALYCNSRTHSKIRLEIAYHIVFCDVEYWGIQRVGLMLLGLQLL